MPNLKNDLYITYSNQKARDLKEIKTGALDKVVTLDSFILELYENNNFNIIIDNILASSIIFNIIETHKIEYFSYLKRDSQSLEHIYNFIVKAKRDEIEFNIILDGLKLEALTHINRYYQEYKKIYGLVDIADIELNVVENFEKYFCDKSYENIYIDCFKIKDIYYIKSKQQENIFNKLSKYKQLKYENKEGNQAELISPKKEVFDSIDEIKTALKIVRILLEDGEEVENILIVAPDIIEYAPLYKLFLNEYGLKGFSSLGTSLTSFHNSNDIKVKMALQEYELNINSLEKLYSKLNLSLSDSIKEKIKSNIRILDEQIGIKLTEPNQIVGLSRNYKHIIFIGTDINHFPPKSNDNFLYSYEDDVNYFYANNYFTSSKTQLDELKRISKNLYIVTASYNGKKELSPSILLNERIEKTIDLSGVKTQTELALESKVIVSDVENKKYYNSIISSEFTNFDGLDVENLDAKNLSASQINKYLSCPLKYLYENKHKLKAPKINEDGFDVMEQGSLMHLCYELFGKYIKEHNLKTTNKDELNELMYVLSLEAYKDSLNEIAEENIHHHIFLSTLQAGLKDDRNSGILEKFVDYYIEKASKLNYFQNTEFEKEFALDSDLRPYELDSKDDRNYFIKGFIDRFDNLEENINVIDYKSKKITTLIDKKKMKDIEELKDIQLPLYLLYLSQTFKDKTYYANLLSFKGDRKYYHFANLSNIENMKDYIYYDDIYEQKLKDLIFNVRDNIENGDFCFNNSDEELCGYCDMKFICHEKLLKKGR